jgi:hypothetical protein
MSKFEELKKHIIETKEKVSDALFGESPKYGEVGKKALEEENARYEKEAKEEIENDIYPELPKQPTMEELMKGTDPMTGEVIEKE